MKALLALALGVALTGCSSDPEYNRQIWRAVGQAGQSYGESMQRNAAMNQEYWDRQQALQLQREQLKAMQCQSQPSNWVTPGCPWRP